MKRRDFMRREFIGLEVEVIGTSHPGYQNLRGRVVDETRNTLIIETDDHERTVPKPGNEFQFTFQGNRIAIRGDEIRYRPEDRIKKCR
jgi:ribonuclease P protein subunit POP4